MKSGGELSILQYSFDTGNKKPVHLSIKCQGISDRIMIQHLAASNCPIQFHVANLRHGRLLYPIHTSNRMVFCHNLLVPESIRASRANWKRTGKELEKNRRELRIVCAETHTDAATALASPTTIASARLCNTQEAVIFLRPQDINLATVQTVLIKIIKSAGEAGQ